MNFEKEYENLKGKVTGRKDDFDRFISFLENETSWLTSPASCKYHLCEEGGLLKHSVGVALTLLKFRKTFAPEISEESCVIVGLLHDVGKIGMPQKPRYLKNCNTESKSNYVINPQGTEMGLAVRSLYLISKYIPLSDSEAQAITYHDGQYIAENKCVAHKEEPLTLLVHWADYWTAHIHEENRILKDDSNYFYAKA